MIRKLIQALVFLSLSLPVFAQINCPSFSVGSGACQLSNYNTSSVNWFSGALNQNLPGTTGQSAILAPTNGGHAGWSLIAQQKQNVQAFTSSFTFVPNGGNIAFVIENQSNQNGALMSAGAGGEGGFSQFAGNGNIAPDKTFAMQFDAYNPMTNSTNFAYSSVQIYQTLQYPNMPVGSSLGSGALPQYATNKISTSPVALDSPATSSNSPSTHTFSATVNYDGYNLTLDLCDKTAGGACSNIAWTGVYIPEIVGADTAWVGFTAGTSANNLPTGQATVGSFSFTPSTAIATPTFTAWNAGTSVNTGVPSAYSPVYSIAPGTYATGQTVAITTKGSPNNYICYTLSAGKPAMYPQPDNNGGCVTGTLYTSPIPLASTSTLYAMAGSSNKAFPLGSGNPTGLGAPSTLVAATYTVGIGVISPPATPPVTTAPPVTAKPVTIAPLTLNCTFVVNAANTTATATCKQ